MKRLLLVLITASGTAVLGACGSGEVIVQAQVADGADGAVSTLSQLVIRLLPYDRDQIFDSLQAAYPEPEPPIPDSLLALQDAIREAQMEYSEIQAAWGTARDSLKTLSDRMDAMGPAGRTQAEYVVMFRDFSRIEPRVATLRQEMDAAFARFDRLQKQFTAGTEEIKLLRQQWGNEAFAVVDSIIFARLDALDLEELADTTDAAGIARFPDVAPGEWWVHARYSLPFQELYWNVPLDVTTGEPLQLQLTRENAQVRTQF